MSWRVRHFLKRLRENKESDECKKILAQNMDISNEIDESNIVNQSDILHRLSKNDIAENNNPLTTPFENNETKDFNIFAPLSKSLDRNSSPFTNSKGRYINWTRKHSELTTQSWYCISDIINFCDKHEYQTLRFSDPNMKNKIVSEVRALLTGGKAPFDICKRFPENIQKPEDLWICIGRCATVEYHLKQMLSLFRRPFTQLLVDKQRVLKQNFRLAVSELRLDISAHITTVNIYDRNIFEHEFQLRWEDRVD